MNTVSTLIERVKDFDVRATVQECIEETADDYVQEQKSQLMHGLDKNGNYIVPSYASPKYASGKQFLNPLPPPGTPDLNLTGAWQDGLQLSVSGDTLDISSIDKKDAELEFDYPDALLLGGDYKTAYIANNLGPVLREQITQQTGL